MPDIVTADRLSPSFAPFINPYVINGYPLHVKGDTTLTLLFSLTNETLNIWSHLVACLVYSCILVQGSLRCDQAWCRQWDDFFMFLFVSLSFFTSMLFSVGFHCFCYISRPIRDRWLTKDIFGVVLGVTGLAISQTYYVLEGYPSLRLKYMVALIASSVFVIKNVLNPESFLSAYKAHINSSKKTVTLLIWGLSSSIPVVHWWCLEGYTNPRVVSFTPRLLLIPVMAVVGVFIYMCRIPERFAPGRFDYVGFSHHIWHVIAFGAQYFWLRTLNHMIEFKYLSNK